MPEPAEVIKAEDQRIGKLAIREDQALSVEIRTVREKMIAYLKRAEDFVFNTEADLAEAGQIIVDIKNDCEPILEKIKPFKDEVSTELDRIRSIEKIFTTTVSRADAAKARGDERFIAFQAIDALKDKMNTFRDELEAKAEAERLKVEEEARKQQEKALKAISDKLNKLQAQGKDKAEQKAFLEKYLEEESDTIDEDEAAQCRARIETLSLELKAIDGKVAVKQTEMERVATPVTVAKEETKVAGQTSKKVWVAVQVTNARLLLQAILDGKVTMACVEFKLPQLSREANNQVKGMDGVAPSIAGVEFAAQRDTRIRK